MEKGNKKKRELQNALKMLAIEKGYANVTMKDIGEYVGLSVGGLYHHYHSVDEIFGDLMATETGDVWAYFDDIGSFDELMVALDLYFRSEEKELLREVPSLNALMYQYYFSLPDAMRTAVMKETHDTVILTMTGILHKVYTDKKLCRQMAEHICAMLNGLVILSFSGSITRETVKREFSLLKDYLKENYETEDRLQH